MRLRVGNLWKHRKVDIGLLWVRVSGFLARANQSSISSSTLNTDKDNANNLLNLQKQDLFSDEPEEDLASVIHLRIFQRNTRKSVTVVEGLDKALNLSKIIKELRKLYSCNGNIVNDEQRGQILHLQGDHRQALKEWFVKEGISSADRIHIHGY